MNPAGLQLRVAYLLLFFCLSGFVFFWLYRDSVKTGAVTGFKFAVLRFSRLYPLHIVTLIAVLVMQRAVMHLYGAYFIYHYNDARHFILNLFLISDWGFQAGWSFNGPVWSVSREVFLYAVFFLLCRLGSRVLSIRPASIALVAAGLVLEFILPSSSTGRGLLCFFMGGLAHDVYESLVRAEAIEAAWKPLLVACLGMWAFIILSRVLRLGTLYGRLTCIDFTGLELFPLTVLTAAVLETKRGCLGRRLSFLGDISYSA